MSKQALARAALAIASPILFLALLDFALVLANFDYPPVDSPIGFAERDLRFEGRNMHESVVGQLWRPRPGEKVPWTDDEFVNRLSFRGPELPVEKTPGVLRIATLGDSSTFGQFVSWDECYSEKTVTKLGAAGVQAEVIAAGVIGFSVRQALERYRLQVAEFEPDIVVGAFGSILEHLGSIGASDDEIIARQQLDENRWVQQWKRLRRDLRVLHLVAWCADSLRGGRDQDWKDRRARELWQTDIRLSLGKPDWPGQRRVSLVEFEKFILELRDEVEEIGGKLVLISLPRRERIEWEAPVLLEYSKKINEIGEREGIPVVDGHAAMVQARKDGHTLLEFMHDNVHPSALGHEYLARSLTEVISKMREAGVR